MQCSSEILYPFLEVCLEMKVSQIASHTCFELFFNLAQPNHITIFVVVMVSQHGVGLCPVGGDQSDQGDQTLAR